MKGKPEFITFTNGLNNRYSNENDQFFANMSRFRENPQPKFTKNLACSHDERIIEDPQFLTLCIRNLENQLRYKEKQYQESVMNLKEKIYLKEIQGRTLNEELKHLRKEMGSMKTEVNEFLQKTFRQKQSPYQLHEPKKKLKKNKSTQFVLFKSKSNSKPKRQYRH